MTLDGQWLDEEDTGVTCPKCHEENVTLRRWRPVTGEPDDLRYWCHACNNIWVIKP